MTRKAAQFLETNDFSSIKRIAKPKYGSFDPNIDFDPMLQVSIPTGKILIDRRREKYWTTL